MSTVERIQVKGREDLNTTLLTREERALLLGVQSLEASIREHKREIKNWENQKEKAQHKCNHRFCRHYSGAWGGDGHDECLICGAYAI